MSEEEAPYAGSTSAAARIVDSTQLDELEAMERDIRTALGPFEFRYDGDGDDAAESDEGVPLTEQVAALIRDLEDSEASSESIRAAIEPVRAWYDGDSEITNDAEMVKAIVEDLQYDRAQAHLIQEILGCTGLDVMQMLKSVKEGDRIGSNARIAIGRLRADVQHAVNVGEPMTIEAILARLDEICGERR